MYAVSAKPLYTLLVQFEWTYKCKEAFNKLKQALVFAPILRTLDWNKVFHVHIDASNFSIGCILAQPSDHNMDFPICSANRQLNILEKKCFPKKTQGTWDNLCNQKI